ERAAVWYTVAAPKLPGLEKSIAEKRIAEAAAVPVMSGGRVVGRPRVVNLLPLVDANADAVIGAWKMADGALVSGNGDAARLQLPYQPPAEYDFVIEYTRQTGIGGIGQILAKSGTSFVFDHGRASADCFFGQIGKKWD